MNLDTAIDPTSGIADQPPSDFPEARFLANFRLADKPVSYTGRDRDGAFELLRPNARFIFPVPMPWSVSTNF
jgi:hypothetical protein